jgi:nitronate monooxygenase
MEDGIRQLEADGMAPAPYAVNLVVHPTNKRLQADLALCIEHEVAVILTSKGAPNDVFEGIHDYGGVAFHDVASPRHAEKALAAGADGLIAVCGGAGGHTGTINPFALMNELRQLTDKPIVLAGGISTGRDILAAQVMGADLVYMGTRFIAAQESLAPVEYREMLFECSSKDVHFTAALDGAPTNFLAPSLRNAGIDPDELGARRPGEVTATDAVKARFSKVWSSGHGVGMVNESVPAAQLCEDITAQYEAAKARMRESLRPPVP